MQIEPDDKRGNRALCIYHGGCTDGVAAAWAVWKARAARVFFPGVYQQEPPWGLIETVPMDSRLIMVDFSYKRDVMEEIVDRCPSSDLLILDHHATAKDDITPLLESGQWDGVFDMDECGALIAWNWFHTGPPPQLLREIDAQDRWTEDRDAALIMALRSYPHASATRGSWDSLMALWDELMGEDGMARLREDAVAIFRYYRARIEEMKARARPWALADHVDVPVVNAPYCFASDVAGELAKLSRSKLAAVWWEEGDGEAVFSVRSVGDIHAGNLCALFGGGGHPGAAGFRLARPDLLTALMVDEVAVA